MNKAALKEALDSLIAEYHMENSSFAKHVAEILAELNAPKPAQRKPLTKQPAQQQEPVVWVDGATHYQPHQKAFYKRVSTTEWYVWSRVEQEPLHWCKALGTSDSAHWILRQPALAQPQPASEWVPVTQALLDDKPEWFYQPLWIAMEHGEIYQGFYEWRQGRYPDKFISDGGLDWVFNATHVMPVVKPTHPAHKENTCPTTS